MRDYFIQFFRKLNSDRRFEQRFYEQVIADVHPYEDNPAYRSLYLSIESLDDLLAGFAVDTLSLSVSAQPPFDPPRQPVGYTAVGPGGSEGLAIPLAQVPRFLAAHRTLLLRIRLTRACWTAAYSSSGTPNRRPAPAGQPPGRAQAITVGLRATRPAAMAPPRPRRWTMPLPRRRSTHPTARLPLHGS